MRDMAKGGFSSEVLHQAATVRGIIVPQTQIAPPGSTLMRNMAVSATERWRYSTFFSGSHSCRSGADSPLRGYVHGTYQADVEHHFLTEGTTGVTGIGDCAGMLP